MKYLIIGSEGFIGRGLARHLRQQGRVLARADVIESSAANYWRVDGGSPDFSGLIHAVKPDIVVNCAGAASVPASLKDPLNDFSLNAHCVFRLLEAVREVWPEARFLNLSSAAVYGNPTRLPVSSDAPVVPVSPYGFHKHMSELICKEYHQLFGLKTISLRIFSAYGVGLRKQLFWDLHQKVRAGTGRVELAGTGSESRDFIYVEDLARAIMLIAERHPLDGGAINVASGTETAIREAVAQFLRFYQPQPEHSFSAVARTGDPLNWVADISELRKLGFTPEWTMERGLEAYHRWLIDSGY